MKLSFFTGFSALVDDIGAKAAIEKSRELGFSGVEFFFMAKPENTIPSGELAKKYKSYLDACGLAAPCVSVGATVVAPENDEKTVDRAVIAKLKECVDFAYNIGSKYLHHTLVMRLNAAARSMDYGAVLPLLLEGAGEIADYAKDKGITILYEPQGMLINGLEGFSEFYRKMKEKHENVAVCGDVGNTYWADEEPYEFFERFAKEIVHAHIKDYVKIDPKDLPDTEPQTKQGGALKEVLVGTGEIDIRRLAKILKSVGYDGFYSIEDGSKNDRFYKVQSFMQFAKDVIYS